MMARRKRTNKNVPNPYRERFRRRENIRSQRKLVIIACEGTKTEPAYFTRLFDNLKETAVSNATKLQNDATERGLSGICQHRFRKYLNGCHQAA